MTNRLAETDLAALGSTGVDLTGAGLVLIDWDGSVFEAARTIGLPSGLRHLQFTSPDAGADRTPLDLNGLGPDIREVVVCCSLERLGFSEIVSCLACLSEVRPGKLTVLIRSEPTADRPLQTLLPTATWTALLEAAGFSLVDKTHLPIAGDLGNDLVALAWRAADIFPREPRAAYVRLSFAAREKGPVTRDVLERLASGLLDLDYRRRKPANLVSPPGRIILNIHHIQDFANLRPLLDVLDPRSVTLLVRETGEIPFEMRVLLVAFAQTRGITCMPYRRVADLDWTDLQGVTVISASECNIWLSHALSRQLVETARALGARTVLLQHGVWVDDSGGSPVSFGSDTVLCWGSEHEESLLLRSGDLLGVHPVAPSTALSRFEVVGAPKFADARAPVDRSMLAARLGVAVDGFEHVALIGTNFHWWVHGGRGGFDEAITELRGRHPNWLFVLKPHPRETLQQYEHLKSSNVIVVDDAVSIMLDVPTSRLIACADIVASPLSSLLIDAAAAAKPVFQFDTKTTLTYRGIDARPFGDLSRFLSDPSSLAELVNRDLARNYADGDHDRFYEKFGETLRESVEIKPEQSLAYVGAYNLIEQHWLQQTGGDVALSDINLLERSGLFDADHYVGQVGEENLQGRQPIEHFLAIGGWRHLDPRPSFNSGWYHARIKDRGPTPEIPVLHYLRQGGRAGLSPHPLIRIDWIRDQLGGDEDMSDNPLGFYLEHGDRRGLSPCPLFDPEWYLRSSPDLRNVPSLLEHYLVNGWREGRSPHPAFSADRYLKLNPDVAASAQSPLMHYVQYGVNENRKR